MTKRRLALVGLLVTASHLPASAYARSTDPLPLGPKGLPEQVTETTLAPGVTLTHVVRGQVNPQDGYEVIVPFSTDYAAIQATAQSLSGAGYSPQVIDIDPPQDQPPGFFGAIIRLGVFATQTTAKSMAADLAAGGFTNITTNYTGFDGFETTTGPWVVNIIDVDPDNFPGRVMPVRAAVSEGLETTSSIARRTGAVVAVNGGYFVQTTADGTPGAPAGISVLDGRLYHEAQGGRSTFAFLPSGYAAVDQFKTMTYVKTKNNVSEQVFGLNRRPGLQRDCGGPVEELPSNDPRQDVTCTIPDDLVLFTPEFGPLTDAGSATAEAILDGDGRVIAVTSGGNVAIPPDGSVLAGLGANAGWLTSHAQMGAELSISRRVLTSHRVALPSSLDFSIVNGGPHLVQHGKISIDPTAEGFAFALPANGNEYYGFGLTRNPRTLGGRMENGHLFLVTVDGRQPGYSVGLSFAESARLMQSLGADQATNLDGGGSTTIAVEGKLFNQPSDSSGERVVGEAIVITGE